MAISQFLPHVIYSVALTSVSLHLLSQRDVINTERAQLSAQISVLESILRQLKTPGSISDVEVERLMKLARAHREEPSVQKRVVSWRDVFFGRDKSAESG
jgi:hypothetical protein